MKQMTRTEIRGYSDSLVVRKPWSWDEVPVRRLTDQRPDFVAGLAALPRLLATDAPNPYDLGPIVDENGQEVDITSEYVFILVVSNIVDDEKTYFVNTEGYDYARYCFEIHPEDVRLMNAARIMAADV